MKLKVSERSSILQQSEIRNMSLECDKIGGINLSQGICDLETPTVVKAGAKKAIDNGFNHYTRYDGLEELRKAIAKKVLNFNKLKVDPEKNIVVSAGTTGALYCALLALLNPKDEIMIFEPYYGYHINTLQAVGAKPIYIKLNPSKGWSFDMKELEKKVTNKTKGIMINTPGNPSGKVFSKEELNKITDFCIKHDLFIFTDEIYEYFIYDGLSYNSPMSIKKAFDRTIAISGYSKTFSTTGWRVGYVICHEKWKKTIGYMNDLVYVNAPSPLQIGIAQGILTLKDDFYLNIKNQYQLKRDKICKILTEIGLTPHIPQGAYYILADVSKVPGKTSKEKAMYILKKTSVATVPGSAFYHGKGGENLVRFCFAKNDTILENACKKLRELKIK